MADKTQFGTQHGSPQATSQATRFGSAGPARSAAGAGCAQCEAMLADLLDGTLGEKELAAFELHRADCTACDQMLADARRGAEMLGLLRQDRPEPKAGMVERIIAATTAAAATTPIAADSASASAAGATIAATQLASTQSPLAAPNPAAAHIAPTPAHLAGRVLPFHKPTEAVRGSAGSRFSASLRRITLTMAQPRLAMTAAMAFFSIALTLNLTGVRLSALKASDLRPAAIERSFYQANAHVVRYYENLRVVYELESRVRELQRASDGLPSGIQDGGSPNSPAEPERAAPAQDSPAKPSTQPRSSTKPGSGTSQRQSLVQPPYRLADFERRALRQHRSEPATRQIGLLHAEMVPLAQSFAHARINPVNGTCATSQEGALV